MVLNQGIKFKFQKQVQTTTGNENGGLKAADDAIKNDSKLQTIFKKIDKGSADGKGADDGVLTDEEIQQFMKDLKTAAGKNGKLSKHEAKKFLKSLGIENADPKALYRFIQTVSEKSANIKNCTMDENGDIIINSEDGSTEETIHSDKTSELKTTDENQNVTTQYKNAAGEVYKKEVKNPDGTTTTIEYEMEGDKTKTDAEGNPVVSKETIVNTETNKTTVISYQNGKKIKSEEKDNSTDETTVIEFDEDGSPKTKTVTKGCVEEQYEYVNGKELLKQKIENKGNDTLESITNYDYDSEGNCTKETKNTPTEEKVTTFDSNGGKTEVITEKDADGQLTENVTTNTLNSDGNKLSQTKTVNGETYNVEYDGDGNTKGVIVQNGESPAMIAKKFGVSVEDLIEANADSVKTNKKGVKFFNVGDEIKIPGELDADKFAELQAGRKTSEDTRADYAKDEAIREQKRAEARAQEEEYKALGLKNYNGKGSTIKGHYKGGKDQEFTVIGECDNGRKLAKSKDGKTVVIAQDGTVLKNDYAKATHAYNAGQGTARADGRGRTVVTGDDGTQYVFSHDGKLLSSEYVNATDTVDNKQANKTVSCDGKTFVKGSDGNIYYFDGRGQLITGENRKALVKAESEAAANKIYSAAHGLGTDEEKLTEGVNEIYSPEIMAQVNSILKTKGYTGDQLTTPIEDLLIDELSRSEVRTDIRMLAANGAYGDEARTDKALGRNAAREIEYEVHGGILGYTRTADLKDAMKLASTRGARLETEELLKDKIKGSPDEGSYVRTYIAEDGFNAKEVDQFDATWIKNNAYDSEHDQEHRNTVTNRLVFSYNSDESLHIALDSIDSDPESADYKNLDEQAAKANKEKKYEAHYTDQNNVQIYLAGRTANSDGSVDAEHVSACNTLLYKGEKPARIQAEEILYNAQKGDMSAVFDSMDPKIYTEMAELIQNGDVKGCTSIQDAYNQAIKNTTDKNDLANIKANAILSGQVEFTDDEIADFCVELMHRIDANRGAGASNGVSASRTNTADYETEQLKAILQAHPNIAGNLKTKIQSDSFSRTAAFNDGTYWTTDTKQDYLDILENTRHIDDTPIFYDADGNRITDEALIKAIQEMNMNSLEDMRAYIAELERELKKGIDAEGALSDMANALSTYSGLGTDRNDAATKYQNAKLQLNQLEAAAQGKLRDSSGNVISLQELAQEIIDKERELEKTNSDYKSTIETGKMGIVLAPVIAVTTVATGGAGAGIWTTAITAGVATGVSEYAMNTIERTTSITGDTAEARESNAESAVVDGFSAAIGVGQMKPISGIAKTTSAVTRGATRFSATVASDVGVGAAGEYVQTGNVTAKGVAMNMSFSGMGNLIGIRSLAKNEVKPGAGKAKTDTPSNNEGGLVKVSNNENSSPHEVKATEGGADNAHAANDGNARGAENSQGAEGAQKASAGQEAYGSEKAQHAGNDGNAQGAEAKQHMSKEEYKKLGDEIRDLEDEINRLKSAAPKKGGNLSAEQVKEYKKVLGIPDNVELTKEELKKAFRQKTIECHPDKGGSNEAMQKVNEANDKLDKFLESGGVTDNNAKIIAEKEAKLKELKAEQQCGRDLELHRFEAETNEKITNLSDGEEFIIGRNDSFALGEVDASSINSRQQIKVKKQNGQYIFENIGLNDCKFTNPDGKTITASGSMKGASGGIKFSKPGKYTIEFPDGTKMQVDIPEPSKNAGGTSKSSAGEQTNGTDNAQHTANNADAQGVKDSQGSDNARHAENDAAAQGTKNSQGAEGAQNAGHAENAKAASAEDVKKSVNDIPESGIPAQNKQLWNKCKTKIDDILNDLQQLKPDLAIISKKMSALFADIESIAMTASREVKAQLNALKTKIENMFNRLAKSINMKKSHKDWVESRKDLFKYNYNMESDVWSQYIPKDRHHCAWKMHLYSVSEEDWREMCDVIIPYLKKHDVEWKTFNAANGADCLNGTTQQGKAFTIYPKNNEDMAQIAKDLDSIIRKNKLETQGSHITGDNQMGDTGRLFYRYEFNSGKYKDKIYDLNNARGGDEFNYIYDKNRGEGKYLADDMTPDDDIWRNFDPSDPDAKPAASTDSSASTDAAKPEPAQYDGSRDNKLQTPEDMNADSIREIDNKINAAKSVNDIVEIQKQLEIDSALKNNQECWSKLYQKCKDMGFPDSQIAALKRASLCRQINNVHKNGSEIVDLINKNPEFESVISDLALNSKRDCNEIKGLLEWINANPNKADRFTKLAKSNLNIKFGEYNGKYCKDVFYIEEAIENYPQYETEILEYMSIQRYGDRDSRRPTKDLNAFIETLEKHSDKKAIILQLSKNPNMDGGTIRLYMNEDHDQMSKLQDVVFLSNKGYSEQGINGIMRSMEKQPELRKIYMSESPKYDLIDKNPAETPKDILDKRFKIRDKLKDSFSDEMETLRKTLGNDFFVKVKWEDIIPEGAADSEIKNILSALNDECKFFARTAGNEAKYGKNIRWAHEMGIISDAAACRLRNGGNFKDVIGNIANDYHQYDVATTRESNYKFDDGVDRRVDSGKYRGVEPDANAWGIGAITPFNDYPSYIDRLTAMNGLKREYKGIKLTEIGNFDGKTQMLHPSNENAADAMPIIEEMHKNLEPYIKKVNQGKTLSESEIKKVHEQVAEIYFLTANVMPWSRGSNGIADIYMRSLYKSMNIDMPALKPDVSLDLESFCMDVDEYKTKWLSFFEK